METLGKILKKIEVQEKSMLADLAIIKADLRAWPGHWCSFCKSSIHALEECSSRRKKATLGAAQCGEDGHASALHFVSDPKLKNNIRIKFGAHFIFK